MGVDGGSELALASASHCLGYVKALSLRVFMDGFNKFGIGSTHCDIAHLPNLLIIGLDIPF